MTSVPARPTNARHTPSAVKRRGGMSINVSAFDDAARHGAEVSFVADRGTIMLPSICVAESSRAVSVPFSTFLRVDRNRSEICVNATAITSHGEEGASLSGIAWTMSFSHRVDTVVPRLAQSRT